MIKMLNKRIYLLISIGPTKCSLFDQLKTEDTKEYGSGTLPIKDGKLLKRSFNIIVDSVRLFTGSFRILPFIRG